MNGKVLLTDEIYFQVIVPICLVGSDGHRQLFDAVIDTGFTGMMTLPKVVADEMDFPIIGESDVQLADNSDHVIVNYGVTMVMEEEIKRVAALAIGDEILLGMRFFRDKRMTIEVTDDGLVTIESIH